MTAFVTRLSRLPADTRTALAFFSRLPIRAPVDFDLRQSAAAWPLAGLLLALGPALLLLLSGAVGLPNLLAALIALAALAALTGALHEDGLADTADGFGGGKTKDAKLSVMRDSRIGTFGVLTLIFSVALRVTALSAIGLRPALAALALVAVAVVSRALALWHWYATLPARREGLAWAAGRPDATAMAIGGVTGAVAAVILLVVFGVAAVIALLLAAAGVVLFSRLCRRQIAGHTGDTIGAAQQIAETFALVGLASGWSPLIWAPILA